MRNYIIIICLIGWSKMYSQDPHFTQFYSAPMSVNPAYTGVFSGQARVITNFRNQWSNLGAPYTTTSLSVDVKVGEKSGKSSNPFNIGAQFLTDKSMNGIFRSNYFGLTAAYHVPVDELGNQTIGAGLIGSFGDRRLDFSQTSFDQQFTSGGFDLNLPTGETALQNMKPFFSVGAGLIYRYDNTESGQFFEAGISAFNLNKPKQSFLSDPNEYLPARFSILSGYQRYLNDRWLINVKALYQQQAAVSYVLGGASAACIADEKNTLIGAGLWYRTGDAYSPYLFGEYRNFRLGLTYDISSSDLKVVRPAKSFEFSLQWRLASSFTRRYFL